MLIESQKITLANISNNLRERYLTLSTSFTAKKYGLIFRIKYYKDVRNTIGQRCLVDKTANISASLQKYMSPKVKDKTEVSLASKKL
ncbi:MAG: hypothetical protein ACEY3J_00535 [Arsenophonus sp.]